MTRGPDEAKRWYWRADRPDGHGGRVHVWTGWASVAEATEAVAQVVAGVAPKPDASLVVTVRDLLEFWIGSYQDRTDLASKTLPTTRNAARRLNAAMGTVRIADLDRAAMERVRDERMKAGDGPSTIMRDWKYLRAAWGWGREMGLVPLRDLPRNVRIERGGMRRVYTDYTPTDEEFLRLLYALPETWERDVLLLLRATGARISEVAAIAWGDVAVDGSTLLIHGKGGLRRTIPLPAGTVARMLSWGERRAAGVSVWPVSRHRIGGGKFGAELGDLSERLGLGGRVSPHGIRRSVTDALYRAGVAPEVEAALLGHSPAVALEHYRRISAAEKSAAVGRTPLLPPVDPCP